LGNECEAPGELLAMFQSDVLRLERLFEGHHLKEIRRMKKLFLAVAVVVAFAAPAMAGHQFPNLYATNSDAMDH